MHIDLKRTALAGVTALALVPATALAATIQGGPGSERLKGTNAADVIDGAGGNDRLYALAGDDTLTGGEGRDRLHGGLGNDTSDGGPGRDHLAGGAGDDVQTGGDGNDVIFANVGVDTSSGGNGNDVLWALARKDVKPTPGGGADQVGDTLDGGPGNDRFRTRDGEVDRVTCGPGRDRAYLDLVDVITDASAENPKGSCEVVQRRAAKAADSKSEDAAEPTPATPAT